MKRTMKKWLPLLSFVVLPVAQAHSPILDDSAKTYGGDSWD